MTLAPPDPSNQLLLRIYLRILRKGPRLIAHWLAKAALTVGHTEGETCCWPCEAKKRMDTDNHLRTIGPRANVYCPKCGLERHEWPKWCANRVVRVNNPPAKLKRFYTVGWDD